MPTKEELIEAMVPMARHVAGLDLTRAPEAEASLRAAFPVEQQQALREMLVAARAEGWLTPRQATDTLDFGRLAKPTEATANLSIDVVDMRGNPTCQGPGHTHPTGEASLCFALEGDPRFMDQPEGWVVAEAGSHHVPTVTGGRMLIAYFLPGGKMEWD